MRYHCCLSSLVIIGVFVNTAFMHSLSTKLLIKIPTRSRPEQFFQTVDLFYKKLSGQLPYQFLISCDTDDQTMNNPEVIDRLKQYPHLNFYFSHNRSKVEAYNSDIEKHLDFDILLVVSDDMEPVQDGYDLFIAILMGVHFPDLDGVLNFNDGYVGGECNTLPVIGKKYYETFGYIYHPDYQSLYCDEELTMVSRMLKREYVSNYLIVRHNHPIHVGSTNKWDELYEKNEGLNWVDQETFTIRKERNFDIQNSDINEKDLA